MTADQHPALVAAVEALESISEGEIRESDMVSRAEHALALLRAAMEKAERRWKFRANDYIRPKKDGDPQLAYLDKWERVTVLRWEE